MSLEEIKTLLEANKDNEEIQSYVRGLSLTPDGVSQFLESDDGKKLIQPKIDTHFTKGLETWKANTLPKVLEDEIKKRYPDESPESQKLRELEQRVEKAEKERTMESLRSLAVTKATELKLPISLVNYLIADTQEATLENISKASEAFNAAVSEQVRVKFKEGGRDVEEVSPTPPSDISKLSMAEYIKYREREGLK